MNELIAKIEQWANDRNIIKGSTPLDQAMKLFSKFGELADAVGKNKIEFIKDGAGDVFVVLAIMLKQQGYNIYDFMSGMIVNEHELAKIEICTLSHFLSIISLNCSNMTFQDFPYERAIKCLVYICDEFNLTLIDCVDAAYNDIKDRKGILSNGVFIKESDPAYASIIASIESNCE